MDQATFQRWRALHVRVARDEPLTEEERAFYQAGEKQLDAEENLSDADVLTELQRLRTVIAAEQAEHDRLSALLAAQDAEIAALEAMLAEHAKRVLPVGG